jgi:hypothetical protein
MGLFDDIVPAPKGGTPAKGKGGLFDDIMAPAPAADLPQDTGEGPMVITVRPTPRPDVVPDAQGVANGNAGAVEPPGLAEAIGRGALQGATFNFGDEITGLAKAAGAGEFNPVAAVAGAARLGAEKLAPGIFGTGGGEAYDAAVAEERARNAAAHEAHPVASFGGELGGALLTLPIAPMLAPFKGAGIASAAGNLAATGAAYGGLAGLGGGEGGPVDRLPSAAGGAATGAVLTPFLGGALAGGGKIARAVADHIRASRNPTQVSDRLVSRAFERDAADPAAIEATLAADQAQRPAAIQNLTAADLAGPNTRGLAGTVTRQPGPARKPAAEFLDGRQIGTDAAPGQGDRIIDQLGTLLGDRQSLATADRIIADRRTQAAPLYQHAFAQKIDYQKPAGLDLHALLDRIPNAAKAKANSILQIEDRGGTQMIWSPTPNAKGGYDLVDVPNARQWDYIKRGLDASIDGHRDPITGALDTEGHALDGLRREVADAMERAIPGMRQARAVYKGHSELLEALRDGKKAFLPSTSVEQIERATRKMSVDQAELFRLGAVNALREKLGGAADGVNKARLAFGNPGVRAKIQAMSPTPKAFAEFSRYLDGERAMVETRGKVLGNSATAERLAEDLDAKNPQMVLEALDGLRKLGHGNVVSLLRTALKYVAKLNPEMRGAVLEEVRKVVLNPDPAAIAAFQQRIDTMPGLPAQVRGRVAKLTAQALPRAVTTEAADERRPRPAALPTATPARR